MDTIDIIITIGILVATGMTAWYARIQAIYTKYQADKRFKDIKEWILRQAIERNIDYLEGSLSDTPQDKSFRPKPKHGGKVTLNELFESAPKKLWDKNWRRQERKFMLLRAIVDLENEGFIQSLIVGYDRAKKHWEHKFGINAIGFSYRNQHTIHISKLCQTIEKASRDISNTIKDHTYKTQKAESEISEDWYE